MNKPQPQSPGWFRAIWDIIWLTCGTIIGIIIVVRGFSKFTDYDPAKHIRNLISPPKQVDKK